MTTQLFRTDILLVKHAIEKKGFHVSVHGDEVELLSDSRDITEIVEAIVSWDGFVHLEFFNSRGHFRGWALVILGNGPGEDISDYSVGGDSRWIDEWHDEFVMGPWKREMRRLNFASARKNEILQEGCK